MPSKYLAVLLFPETMKMSCLVAQYKQENMSVFIKYAYCPLGYGPALPSRFSFNNSNPTYCWIKK